MIPDCDRRSDGRSDGRTESIIAKTALVSKRMLDVEDSIKCIWWGQISFNFKPQISIITAPFHHELHFLYMRRINISTLYFTTIVTRFFDEIEIFYITRRVFLSSTR